MGEIVKTEGVFKMKKRLLVLSFVFILLSLSLGINLVNAQTCVESGGICEWSPCGAGSESIGKLDCGVLHSCCVELACTSFGREFEPGDEYCPFEDESLCFEGLIPFIGTHIFACNDEFGGDKVNSWRFTDDCSTESSQWDCKGDKICKRGNCVEPACTSFGREFEPGDEYCPFEDESLCFEGLIPFIGTHIFACNDEFGGDKVNSWRFTDDCSTESSQWDCKGDKICKRGNCVSEDGNGNGEDDECKPILRFLPNIPCLLSKFIEDFKILFSIVLGLMGGAIGAVLSNRFIKKSKRKNLLVIGALILAGSITGLLAWFFFWQVLIVVLALFILLILLAVILVILK